MCGVALESRSKIGGREELGQRSKMYLKLVWACSLVLKECDKTRIEDE